MSVCQNFLFMARLDDLRGSYRFTRIPSHVSAWYRFALVKVTRPSDSLILLVACPAVLPSAALSSLLPFTCPLLPLTALYCLYCPYLPFTAPCCPLLHGQWLIKRSGRYRLGYRLGIDYGTDCLAIYHTENLGTNATAERKCHNR